MKLINISKLKNLLLKVLLIVSLFTLVFSIIPNNHWNNMDNNENKEQATFDYLFNRIYFITTTFSTAGYGDITPKSKYAKIATILLQISVIVMVIDHISI